MEIPTPAPAAAPAPAPAPVSSPLPPGVTQNIAPAPGPPPPASAPPLMNSGGITPSSGGNLLKDTNWVMVLLAIVAVTGIFVGITYARKQAYTVSDKQKETELKLASIMRDLEAVKKSQQ